MPGGRGGNDQGPGQSNSPGIVPVVDTSATAGGPAVAATDPAGNAAINSASDMPWMAWMHNHEGEIQQTGAPPTPFTEEIFKYTNYGPLNGSTPQSCAATVCAALEETGFKSTRSAAAISFVSCGQPCQLKTGCIVVYQWDDGDHHVDFCDEIIDQDSLRGFGGNQGHQVKDSIYPRKNIIATRWPVPLQLVSSISPAPVPAAVLSAPIDPGLVNATETFDQDVWLQKALLISMRFEGSDPWANITGNFDGAGLTCGALGWTFQGDNQQPLVKEFVEKYGEPAAKALMPSVWDAYWSAVNQPWQQGMATVGQWSHGSTVLAPYLADLRSFWKSPGMIGIQKAHAWSEMGVFAKQQTDALQTYLKTPSQKFHWFAFWFDQAVQNGGGKLVDFATANQLDAQEAITWCKTVQVGDGAGDVRKNAAIWQPLLATALPDEVLLFKLGYLRSLQSVTSFEADVMQRRGTLALGHGIVHGDRYDLVWT